MNALKNWVKRSREEEKRNPERYIASYPDLVMDDTHVLMTKEQLEKIRRECGRYDGTYPTGVYLGKMFLRWDRLCWFTWSRSQPMTRTDIESRIIQVVE